MAKKATVLPPDTRLKSKLANRKLDELVDEYKLKKAGKVIKQNAVVFHEQAREDIKTLVDTFQHLTNQQGQDPVAIQNIASTVYRIKSLAGTFGYHLATVVAKDFYNYLGERRNLSEFGMTVAGAYVNTLRSIFTHDIYGDGGTTGRELLESLHSLVEKEHKSK